MKVSIIVSILFSTYAFSGERARYTSPNKRILIQRKNELSLNQGYCKAEVEITNRVEGKLNKSKEWIRCAKKKGRCPGSATSCLVDYRKQKRKPALQKSTKNCKGSKI